MHNTEADDYYGVAENQITGETRLITVSAAHATQVLLSGVADHCAGNCDCSVEPDGVCGAGWPARINIVLNQYEPPAQYRGTRYVQ